MVQVVSSGNFAGGLILDLPAATLQPHMLSGGMGFLIRDGVARRASPGSVICDSPVADGRIMLPYTDTSSIEHFIVCGSEAIFDVTSTATDITPVGMAEAVGLWSAVNFGGTPVLTNPTGAAYYLAETGLEELPYDSTQTWASVSMTAMALRTYKNFLVCCGYNIGAETNAARVLWSHPAAPGELPASWDIADPTYLAGDQSFAGAGGSIVTGLEARDSFLIYRESAIHRMTFVPGYDEVMTHDAISNVAGALAVNAVAQYPDGHVALTNDDIVVTDGITVRSIAEKSVRRTILSRIDGAYYLRAQLVRVGHMHEVWVCIPTPGSSGALTEAWVWNWDSGTWSYRELPGLTSWVQEAVSVSASAGEAYDERPETETFETAEGTVSGLTRGPSALTVQALREYETAGIMSLSSGFVEIDDVTRTYRLERTGLILGDAVAMRKHVVEVVLEATGGSITVQVGAADSAEAAPNDYTWGEARTWQAGVTRRMRYRSPSGLYHGLRLTFADDSETAIHRYSLVGLLTGPR